MRVLIAYEDSHRSYGEAMGVALRERRPGMDVSLVRAEELGDEVARLDPHLMVCGHPNAVDPGGRAAWVRISNDPCEPSEFCLGGRRGPLMNPDFEDLLALVDGAGELVRGRQRVVGC